MEPDDGRKRRLPVCASILASISAMRRPMPDNTLNHPTNRCVACKAVATWSFRLASAARLDRRGPPELPMTQRNLSVGRRLLSALVAAAALLVGLVTTSPAGAWTSSSYLGGVVHDGRVWNATIPDGDGQPILLRSRPIDGGPGRLLRIPLPPQPTDGQHAPYPYVELPRFRGTTAFLQVRWCDNAPERSCTGAVIETVDATTGAVTGVIQGEMAATHDTTAYLYGAVTPNGRTFLLDPLDGTRAGVLPSHSAATAVVRGRFVLTTSGGDRWVDESYRRGSGASTVQVFDLSTGSRRFAVSARRIATAAGPHAQITGLDLMDDGSIGVRTTRTRKSATLRPVYVTPPGRVRALRHPVRGAAYVLTAPSRHRVLVGVDDERSSTTSCSATWLTDDRGTRARRLFFALGAASDFPASWDGDNATWPAFARRTDGHLTTRFRLEPDLRTRHLNATTLPACTARR
ncbi:hypothetical protein AB0L40_06060 [Patulibacter sp. NPDC049589]|uniref:hypothetical protein n=1 Tax=Patulibacter sp. NPDC049589 TaxID=3154731 RepID=UPI00343D1505